MGGIYEGVGGVRREMAACPAGIGGVTREAVALYAGVGGVRRLVWQKPQDGGSVTVYYGGDDLLYYDTTVTVLQDVQEESPDGYEFHIVWTGEREDSLMSVMEGEWFYMEELCYYGKVGSTYDDRTLVMLYYE